MSYIVVTNDDGVDAPGLLALAQAMRALGRVEVIAPAVNQSASGHKRTVGVDIPVREVTLADGSKAVSVGASPADCIALAALGAVDFPPRVVVSGINRGQNMGQDITSSGTVTAAIEATLQGVPSVAVSLARRDANSVEDYAPGAQVAVHVVEQVLKHGLPPLTLLNINIPPGEIKGLRLTRQGVSIYHDSFERDGETWRVIWSYSEGVMGVIDEPGTDLYAVHNGYASLTPLHLDMTAHRFLADLAAWDITL